MKVIVKILALCLAIGLLGGCTDTPAESQASSAASTGAEGTPMDASGERTLNMTMMLGTDVATLDPFLVVGSTSYLVCKSLYTTPWVMDKQFNIHYQAATGYEVSGDGLVYTITLRDDVKDHSGNPITSEDFVYSALNCIPGAMYNAWSQYFDTVEAIDPTTVKITLSKPFSPLIASMGDMPLVSKAAHEAAGKDFGYTPVGTGPYRLREYNVGESITIEAVEDYYLEPAAIKTVSYKLIPEKSTVSIALETKEIDFSSDYSATDQDRLIGLDYLQLVTQPVSVFNYVTFNTTVEPFTDARVRQAINYAINREAVVQVSAEGYGTPTGEMLTEQIFGYAKTEGFDYDPERAKELLAEAGYPNGEGLPMCPIYVYATEAKDAQVIQQNLKDIGIDWPIEECDISLLIDYMGNGTAAISVFASGLLVNDASEFSSMLHSQGGYNDARYANTGVDEWFDLAVETPDNAQRLSYYRKIWEQVQQDAPYAMLYYHTAQILCSADLDVSKAETYGMYGSTNILPYYLSWK